MNSTCYSDLYRQLRPFFAAVLVLFLMPGLFAIVEETASFREFMYGDTDGETAYDNFYSRIVSGIAVEDYNQYAPWEIQSEGFGNFRRAGWADRYRWGLIVDSFLDREFDEALDYIDDFGFPYDIVKFNDTDTERTYYMLRERLNPNYFCDNGLPDQPEMHQQGSFDYGWGLYVYNPDSENPIVITTPHPKDDFITVPISAIAHQKWDARYLMVAGAGREVDWTEEGNYTNAKSLSDPTRVEEHVFNVFYQAACSEIRSTFGRREFSPQLHSFDYTHMGYNSLQISAGNWNQNYPGLPIRDLSGNYLDIVNAAPYVIFEENTIGTHEEVLVTDYYSVHYSTHGHYYNHDGEMLEISNNINLPGFSRNRQVAHTLHRWNRFDVVSPFFHIEMEELPSCFEQDMETYHWLYGYDAETETWDAENLFTNAITYYTPWVEHLAEVLPAMFEFDDEQAPTDPGNLRATDISYGRNVIAWNRSRSYNFETYEILLAQEPIDLEEENYSVLSRNNISTLAGQAYTSANLNNLTPGNQYYFKIRAKDYTGNYSDVSNQIDIHTKPAQLASIRAYGRDSAVDIEWTVDSQQNNRGFTVYRYDIENDLMEEITDYEADSTLVGQPQFNAQYKYTDTTAENGVLYEYIVASNSASGEEFLHGMEAAASPEPIYSIYFINQEETAIDSLEFGMNRYTEDGLNFNYDLSKREEPPDNYEDDYIYANFYYPREWQQPRTLVQRKIKRFFDAYDTHKTWKFRLKSNIRNQNIMIGISENYNERTEHLYLICDHTEQLYDLTSDQVNLQLENNHYHYWTMYWGKLEPNISISYKTDRYYQAGDEIRFEWRTDYPQLIESYKLYLSGDTDSLLVAEDLDGSITYYDWAVPDSLMIDGLNLNIRGYLSEESFIETKSPYSLGLLPSGYEFTLSPGWHLITNPFTEPNPPLRELLGENAIIRRSYYSTPDSIITFRHRKSYWVYTEDELNYRIYGTANKKEMTIDLTPGWNLIPNVMLQNIDKKDLQIVRRTDLGEQVHSFRQAVSANMIAKSLFGYKNSMYSLSDTLRIGHAYWLYSHRQSLSVRFKPQFRGQPVQPRSGDWETSVRISQGDYIIDEVIIGAPDIGANNLKPPARPGQQLSFFISENNRQMHSVYKRDIEKGSNDEYRDWAFTIELSSLIQPLEIELIEGSLPEKYNVVMFIDPGIVAPLSREEATIISPANESITGVIRVTFREHPSSTEEQLLKPALYSNYPNPFMGTKEGVRSGGTIIRFFMDENEKAAVDIFNIRGRKITTLIDDYLDQGEHTIHWNGRDDNGNPLPSGVYFYRLQISGKTISTNKMMLLR